MTDFFCDGQLKAFRDGLKIELFTKGIVLPTFHLILPFPLNPKVIPVPPQGEFLRWQSPAVAIKDTRQRRTVIDSRGLPTPGPDVPMGDINGF
jgi:hypothetical protein